MAVRDKWSTNKRVKPGSGNTTSAGRVSAKAPGLNSTSRMVNALGSFVRGNKPAGQAPAPKGAKPRTKPSTWSIYSFSPKRKV